MPWPFTVETVHYFLCKLGMKPQMHVLERSLFPIDAYVVLCPSCTKNLRRSLLRMRNPLVEVSFFFFFFPSLFPLSCLLDWPSSLDRSPPCYIALLTMPLGQGGAYAHPYFGRIEGACLRFQSQLMLCFQSLLTFSRSADVMELHIF